MNVYFQAVGATDNPYSGAGPYFEALRHEAIIIPRANYPQRASDIGKVSLGPNTNIPPNIVAESVTVTPPAV